MLDVNAAMRPSAPSCRPGAPRDREQAIACVVASRIQARHIGALTDGLAWPDDTRAKRELVFKAVGAGGQVLVCGDRGTGKTQLAAEIAMGWYQRGLDDHNGRVVYWRLLELFDRQRKWIGDPYMGREYRQESPVEAPKAAGLLILDDVHDRKATEFEEALLSSIVDYRYGHHKPTLMLTNETPDRARETLGDSVVDRCKEEGMVVAWDFPSMRQASMRDRRNK